MRKPRLAAIEYIRGIAMLGVIGIHVGSVYSEIPAANIHMVALLEILTRFSVPIFSLFLRSDFSTIWTFRKNSIMSISCAVGSVRCSFLI